VFNPSQVVSCLAGSRTRLRHRVIERFSIHVGAAQHSKTTEWKLAIHNLSCTRSTFTVNITQRYWALSKWKAKGVKFHRAQSNEWSPSLAHFTKITIFSRRFPTAPLNFLKSLMLLTFERRSAWRNRRRLREDSATSTSVHGKKWFCYTNKGIC